MTDEFSDLYEETSGRTIDEFSDLAEQKNQEGQQPEAYAPPSIYGGVDALAETAHGVGEVALSMGTGAVTSMVSGAVAATAMGVSKILFGNSLFEPIKGGMDAFNDALTFQPRTEHGQWVLEQIAGPMLYIDDAADEIATKHGGGNPWAETIIKTSLLGTLELASPARGVKNVNTAIRHTKASKNKIAETANALGIDPTIRDLKESVVDAANKMTPDEKGANAPLLQEAMREANVAGRDAKNAAYMVARDKDVWVDTRAINDLAAESRMRISETYDISEMTKLNKRFADMSVELPGNNPKVRFWELEKIRRKMNSSIQGLKRSDPEQAAAMGVLKRDLDRFIENEFNKTALEVGQQGPQQWRAITGEADGIQAWKNARELNAQWKEDFSANRAIKDLIEQDATPEMITDWILGANAMGGKKQAALTVRKLREVLGDNHPAMEGVRQDFLFRVTEPLMRDAPNFKGFIDNYDKMIKNNHTMVAELGLKEGNFSELVTFAREANKLPVNQRDFKFQDITKGLAVFWQGHEMAKRSLRVGYARNILNGMFNLDRVAQKTLLYDMGGIRYGYPAMPKKGPLAAKFIAGESLQEILRAQERRETSVAEVALRDNK